jgi:cobalt-zinc-cadmium efflux system membrane fusion protein
MMLNIDKKSQKAALIIVLIGAVLGAAILLWKKDSGGGTAEAQHAENSAKKDVGDHAGEEGVVLMSEKQIQTAGVTLAKAEAATMGNIIQLPGEVRFNEDLTAHIVPRTPGVAESVSADLGQSVKKGQVLAVISSPALADLRSASLAAQKRLVLAQTTYLREKKLWEDKISAEQDYLQAQTVLREAEIEAQTARSKLAALGAGEFDGALNRYVLRAPFDGVIVEKHITQGKQSKKTQMFFCSRICPVCGWKLW